MIETPEGQTSMQLCGGLLEYPREAFVEKVTIMDCVLYTSVVGPSVYWYIWHLYSNHVSGPYTSADNAMQAWKNGPPDLHSFTPCGSTPIEPEVPTPKE